MHQPSYVRRSRSSYYITISDSATVANIVHNKQYVFMADVDDEGSCIFYNSFTNRNTNKTISKLSYTSIHLVAILTALYDF